MIELPSEFEAKKAMYVLRDLVDFKVKEINLWNN